MGLLLRCDRRIPDQVADLRQGQWNKGEYSKARGLYGRTLGIVGLGQIGREIAARAQAFGMRVVAWSRSLTHRGGRPARHRLLPRRRSRWRGCRDAVTINVAANAETKHLVNAEFLAAMQPGAYLINTSRGSVVDEAALAAGDPGEGDPRRARRLPGRAGGRDRRVHQRRSCRQPGVYGTHHVGASTDQAQVAIAHEVIRIVQALPGRPARCPTCVNRLARSSATHVLSIRHRNRPGVLAHVFGVLAGGAINVEEVENIIYHGAQATLARIHLDGVPDGAALGADSRRAIRTSSAWS